MWRHTASLAGVLGLLSILPYPVTSTYIDGKYYGPIGRIVGGVVRDATRYPYLVSLLENQRNGLRLACGGTLLAPNVVLTAGHCTQNSEMVEWGRGFEDINGRKVQRRGIRRVINHPDFVLQHYDWDVGLILLDEPFDDVPTVTLLDSSHSGDLTEELLTVIGRGSTKHYQEPTEYHFGSDGMSDNFKTPVHEITIQESEINACRAAYNEGPLYAAVTSNMLCARGPDQDSCVGDSGGPMILQGVAPEQDVQVAIVSWGWECGNENYPGVYHRLSESLQWVKKTQRRLLRLAEVEVPAKKKKNNGGNKAKGRDGEDPTESSSSSESSSD